MKQVLLIAFLYLGIGMMDAPAQVVVKRKPAAPKVVVVKSKRPSARHIWVAGHWKWNPRRKQYVWVDGKWFRPKKGHVYVAGRWKQTRGGYVWVSGYWRKGVA